MMFPMTIIFNLFAYFCNKKAKFDIAFLDFQFQRHHEVHKFVWQNVI